VASSIEDLPRPDPPLASDELATLLGFLDYQRATFTWKCSGLGDEQLKQALHPTDMTLAGLLKHLARVEDGWFNGVVASGREPERWASVPWGEEWQSALTERGSDLRTQWAASVEASRAIVAAQVSGTPEALETTHPAWDGQGRVSLRWVLVHMIEEYARHNGHADLLREAADGATGE
jgi:uncharacterized damage-inducible protein DinB